MNNKRTVGFLLVLLTVIIVSMVGLPFDKFGLDSNKIEAYVSYDNLGQVIFNAQPNVMLYSAPGGTEISSFTFVADADGNGFDSYVVWQCKYYEGDLWLGLFVGADVPAWVPFASISRINEQYPFDPAVCPAP
jgi:hypothetical protein